MFLSIQIPDSQKKPRVDDPQDFRLGAFVQTLKSNATLVDLINIPKGAFVVLGYPDDRGVLRNAGREGARLGPDKIRQHLYGMTPSPELLEKLKNDMAVIFDLGNLFLGDTDLVQSHRIAMDFVKELQIRNCKIISLGGGHDWAWSDFKYFCENKESFARALINFDAHLDMRPQPESNDLKNHSGTAFRRLLEAPHPNVEFYTFGLQEHCNASHHLNWAKLQNAHLEFLNTNRTYLPFQNKGIPEIGFSIDLDAFSSAHAPGVSAPQADGLDPKDVLDFIRAYGSHMTQLGIYELNPLFDRDDCTARLAAKIVHTFLLR